MTRIYRSNRDKMLTGVCGGLSDATGIDSIWIRILTLISIPFTGGATFLIYIIAAVVISKEPGSPYDGFGPGNGSYNHPGYDPRYHGGNGMGAGRNGSGPSNSSSYGAPNQQFHTDPKKNDLDFMMEDIEKKAMKKELAELRKKLEGFEKGER